ncbi:MAG TPA: serine/threonine-protein kinase, partial [Verrucomicrobiae bacterium]|nr:serine/threonine-protein kinase [Verrucomicrobiae bacterium]
MKAGKAIDPLTNTSHSDQCLRCGAAIPAASIDRVCPACLLSGVVNLEEETETLEMRSDDGQTGGAAHAPAPFGPSSFPCVFGGYRLLSLLGSGGMGAVYEAEHLATGRRVGLKMLNQRLDSSDMRRRFLREGRLAAAVSHPNSLYVFGSEEIEGYPVITMELAAGGTLKDKLDQRGPLPVAEAVDAMLDVIAGLEAAFAGGVLHRDIKPSNCFVDSDGSVKVGDFGLSVSTLGQDGSFVTATGVIMGTPAYAAPEQLRGDELDARADIYSVGATLFTLLTGRAPFDGQNAVQVVANAVNQKPKSMNEWRKDVPSELDSVVARCLAKEPGQRFADYAALRNALLPFSSREPEPAPMKLRASSGWMDFLIAFLV